MPVIGTFTPAKDGYNGSITTLALNAEVSILPNQAKQGHNAPDFLLMAGGNEVGAAWRRTNHSSTKAYLNVKLDVPYCSSRSGPCCSRTARRASPAWCGGATQRTTAPEPTRRSPPAPAAGEINCH